MAGRRNTNRHALGSLAVALSVTRFWDLVETLGPDDCWLWRGDFGTDGYGVFMFDGKRTGAHELALSFSTGEARLPELDTCHSCDNRRCVNPRHLRFDTRKSNVNDMIVRDRQGRSGRLTDDQIVLIRRRRAAGARQKDLAEQFGVSDGQISMIVRGIRWANVGGPIESKRNQYRKAA